MNVRQHVVLLLASIVCAFLWLRLPWLNSFSLQAVALVVAVYFIIKRLNKSKLNHLLPKQNSAEMSLVTFGMLLLVGKTGAISSPLFPLIYIHLFFLVMSSSRSTAAIVGSSTVLYLFALEPLITTANIGHLITIPVVLIFFMFAREQHEEVIRDQQELQQEELLVEEYSEETTQLKSTISQLELEENQRQAVIQTIQPIIKIAQAQIQSWSQRYFACEPKALSEANQLQQYLDQALSNQSAVADDETSQTKII